MFGILGALLLTFPKQMYDLWKKIIDCNCSKKEKPVKQPAKNESKAIQEQQSNKPKYYGKNKQDAHERM